MLLKEIKSIFHNELLPIYPAEEIDSFFYWFVEHYLNLDRFVLALHPEYGMSKSEEGIFFEGLGRLRNEEPIQYILGEAHFMDIKLKVTPDVLIPRPETVELVHWIIDSNHNQKTSLRILDIGTGSGCIAITLAKAFPRAKVYALDVSDLALQVAKENASSNRVAIQFRKADILDPEIQFDFFGQENHNHGFDCIVSNPPYVRESEQSQMRNNVLQYEPKGALFVADDTPLLFYRAIVDFSKKHLCSSGSLFFEINQYLASETERLLVDNDFNEVELRKDIFGNFRMLKGLKP